MSQHVTVTDYDPRWPQKYEEEKEKIRHILGEDLVAIYHIGSTSVPGLAAKPIIDIMAAVKSLDRADQAAGKFIQIGYFLYSGFKTGLILGHIGAYPFCQIAIVPFDVKSCASGGFGL